MMTNTSNKNIIYILFILPIILHFALLFHFAENIPHLDDYPTILGFIQEYLKSNSLHDKIQLIFAQYNDHRIALVHLISLWQYNLIGEINFKYLVLIGNISIICILFTLLNSSKICINKLYYMLPIVYLLFSFRFYEGNLWAMVTLSGLFVVAFSIATIMFIDKEGYRYFAISCLLSIFAMYTQGNGILVLACGLILLILKKKWKKVAAWTLFSLLLCFSDHLFKSSFKGYSKLSTILMSPYEHILSIFTFLGMIVDSFWVSLFIGCAIILYFAYLCYVRYYEKNAVLFIMLFYIILNAIAVGYARPMVRFPQRYSIYSVLAVILVYMIYIEAFVNLNKNHITKYLIKIMVVPSIIYYIIYIPLGLQFYKITFLDYESNIIKYNLADTGSFRQKANIKLNEDLKNMPYLSELYIIPNRFSSYYISRKKKAVDSAMMENIWWLKDVNCFSGILVEANLNHIYNNINYYK